jgi:plastocyanin
MTRSARRLLAGVVLAVAAGGFLAACGPGAGSAANGSPVATANVDLPPSYKFVPPAITVPAGTTVTWTNHDNFSHNVTLADGTPTMPMSPGESVTHTFATPGVYAYVCSLHPKDMKGSVTVTGG